MALDYYRLLGIPPDADQHRIRTVYRRLAKRFHPDTNHGSEAAAELFRQVNEAYRVLSDPQRREHYDQELNLRRRTRVAEAAPSSPAGTDPAHKFSRFINSLLDAVFAPDGEPVPQPASRTAPARPVKTPSFNFYYHLAMEKGKPEYRRGRDGVYRKVPRPKPPI